PGNGVLPRNRDPRPDRSEPRARRRARGGRWTRFGVYGLMPGIRRRSNSSTVPVSFWAFGILWLDGELLVHRSYADRRAVLEELPLNGACRVVQRFPGTDAP